MVKKALNFKIPGRLVTLLGMLAVIQSACVPQMSTENRKCPCHEPTYSCCEEMQQCFLKTNFEQYCTDGTIEIETADTTSNFIDTATSSDTDTKIDNSVDTTTVESDSSTDTTTVDSSSSIDTTTVELDSSTDTIAVDLDSSTEEDTPESCLYSNACVVYVDAQNMDTSNQDGSEWKTAFTIIQEGIDKATARIQTAVQNDTDMEATCEVRVAQGTYRPTTKTRWAPLETDTDIDMDTDTVADSRFRSIVVRQGVQLVGGFSGNPDNPCQRDVMEFPTILSGDILGDDFDGNTSDNVYTVVWGEKSEIGMGSVELKGAVELNGVVVSGGMSNHEQWPSWQSGGGLYIDSFVFANIVDCRFQSNYAKYVGGAIFAKKQSGYAIVRSTFENNHSQSGGAIFNDEETEKQDQRDIVNSMFINNIADFYGGAIFNESHSMVAITGTVFVGNIAKGDSNYHFGLGGAIHSSAPDRVTVTNCTFWDNQAVRGSALYNNGPGMINIFNSIVWGNNQAQGAQIANDQINPIVAYSIVQDWDMIADTDMDTDTLSGFNVSLENPLFTGTDLLLSEGSPAINAGLNDFLPADLWDIDSDSDTDESLPVDIAKQNRVMDSTVDLGAKESAGAK